MLIVFVHVHVKSGMADAFVEATRKNAQASLGEPGVLRFDVVREQADADKFVLVEVYRDEQAPAAHKKTAHYEAWRAAVEPMMASPRHSTKYSAVEPLDASGWRTGG
jgi:quinol monooxygenase YgiN